MQLLVSQLGGKVSISSKREFGRTQIKANYKNLLFGSLKQKDKKNFIVWMSHGDKVVKLPNGFKSIASSYNTKFAAIENVEQKFYGLQFHPEVVHTVDGSKIIKNFIFKIAKCKKNWSMKNHLQTQKRLIKDIVGSNHVICGLSGGVDSTVTAAIISKAIGKQLTCIYVDTGLMRLNETKEVSSLFKRHFKSKLIIKNSGKEFIKALRNVSDPEKKRKIIGNLFIKIFDREAKKISKAKYLAQGTIYPDVIESQSFHGGPSSVIKSHHNVGGLPKKMKLKLIEPLKFLFKDEVRKLGLELNLSREIISRHPFPGPGLAIRMPGIITKEKINILKEADHYFIQALRDHNLYHKIWQAYAALLPVKTVGVMGDNRTYEYLCLLRAITSEDGMTADFYEFKKSFIQEISNKIVNSIRGINRVVYDITSKPPSTIELE